MRCSRPPWISCNNEREDRKGFLRLDVCCVGNKFLCCYKSAYFDRCGPAARRVLNCLHAGELRCDAEPKTMFDRGQTLLLPASMSGGAWNMIEDATILEVTFPQTRETEIA